MSKKTKDVYNEKNAQFLKFYTKLQGYKLYRGKREIPKYIAFWQGNTFENISEGTGLISMVQKQEY